MSYKPLLIVLFIFFFLTSCTKIQTTDIGTGLIPPIDGVNTIDTSLDLITNTFFDNFTARVYKNDYHIIGTISNDPIFGKTQAATFFELKPPFYNYVFSAPKSDIRPDSAVLILSYKGAYGDTTIPQTWRVYEIDNRDTLKYDSAYGTQTNVRYSNLLGTRNNINITTLDDSVKYGFENAKNQIRIKLDASFANRMMKVYDSTNAYKSDSAFRNSFAGFAVVPDAGSGNALIKINLLDTNTKLALFYTFKSTVTAKDSSVVSYFRFRSEQNANGSISRVTSGSANIIKRDYSGSKIASAVNSNKNDSLVYVQTSPGSFVQVKVPGLATFPNSIIHRAELITEQVPDNPVLEGYLTAPRYLLLSIYDSVNKINRNILNDYVISTNGAGANIGTFGGFLNHKDVGGITVSAYDFTLTRYVQGIVSRKDTSFTLRISAPTNDSLRYHQPYPSNLVAISYLSPNNANDAAVGRVRLGGGFGDKNRKYRMRLRIIYSKL